MKGAGMKYFPQECILTLEELNKLCEEWKSVLGLENWNTSIKICRDDDMEGGAGHCHWVLPIQCADIKILDHVDWYKIIDHFPQDMEKTIVHELLHCRFAVIDKAEDGTLEELILHQNIDMLACALVGIKREANGNAFEKGKGEENNFKKFLRNG
jgi:hypothetical protein